VTQKLDDVRFRRHRVPDFQASDANGTKHSCTSLI
jgi:hypothetical protein